MGRKSVHDWRDGLTDDERRLVGRLELTLDKMAAKIKATKTQRHAIRGRASKRIARDDKIKGNK